MARCITSHTSVLKLAAKIMFTPEGERGSWGRERGAVRERLPSVKSDKGLGSKVFFN